MQVLIIDSKHEVLLPASCVRDLSGLVFGVPPEKGVQLLLEPEIAAALQNADEKKLDELYQSHGDGFWHIFNYHFEHYDMNLDYLLNSAKAIYNSIWKDHNRKCAEFINRVTKIDLNISRHINWSAQHMNKYICLINICYENKSVIQNIYHHLINCLRDTLNKDENIKWVEVVTSLSNVVNAITDIDVFPSRETIDGMSL